jgi:hypothetical protein
MIANHAEIGDSFDSNGYSCINDWRTSINDPRESLGRAQTLWVLAKTSPLTSETVHST